MISSLDPSGQQFLNSLNRIAGQLDVTQRQITTGVRLTNVSDNPDQVSALLQARADLSAAQQIQTNLGRVKTEVDAGEQALQNAEQLFENARTLAAEGVTGTQTAASRVLIGQQVGGILEELAGATRTTVDGRYIFSGDSDQQVPYTVDLTQAAPVSAYAGSAATRVAQHPNGTTFAVSHTAQEIFDSADPTTNVFSTLATLYTALMANDTAGIQSAVDTMPKVGEYLNDQLAFYGTTQDKVAQATDFGSNLQLQLQGQISTLSDADLTGSILELNRLQTQQQAALQSEARLPRTSLFDFLA